MIDCSAPPPSASTRFRPGRRAADALRCSRMPCALALAAALAATAGAQPGAACTVAEAGSPLDCPVSSPAAIADTGPGSAAGNPIDVITGNKYQLETDLPPLPGPLGLEIRRHYNSSERHTGVLGTGWRLSYEAELHDHGTGLTIVQADGRRIALRCAAGVPRTCVARQRSDGSVRVEHPHGRVAYRWHWPDGRELEFRPLAGGVNALRRIRLTDGAALTITHDSHGRPVQVRDPQGRTLHLAYGSFADGVRRLARVATPIGQWTYDYDVHGRLSTASGPGEAISTDDAERPLPAGTRRQSVRHYHYADTAAAAGTLLTGISVSSRLFAPGGPTPPTTRAHDAVRIAGWSYDERGRAVASAGFGDAGRVRLAFLPDGRTQLINADGASTFYRHRTHAGVRRIVAAVGPGCAACPPGNRRYEYEPDGALRAITVLADDGARALSTIRARRDALGRVTQVTRERFAASGSTRRETLLRVGYHGTSWQPARIARPSLIAGREHVVEIAYDRHRQPALVTETGYTPSPDLTALRRSWRFVRDAAQRLVGIDGPLPGAGDTVRYAYDDTGRVSRVVPPTGPERQISYDAAGRIARVAPADGEVTEYSYTAQGSVATVRHGSELLGLRRDAMGRVREALRNGIPALLLAHDPGGRLRFIADDRFALAALDYDHAGRLIGERRWTHGGSAERRQRFDQTGRLRQHVAVDGGVTTLDYDRHGLPALLRDPAGIVAAILHDDGGQERARVDAANSALPAVLKLEHDAHGALAGLTAPDGGRYAIVRDDFGRVVASTHPQAGTSRFRYDEADRLIERSDADGTRRSYRYDDAGRLVERIATAPGAATRRVALRYRGDRLVAIADDAQTEERRFDRHGRVLAITRRFHGAAPVTAVESFGYAPDGLLATRTLADGSLLQARRNAAGRLVALDWSETPGAPVQPIVSGIEHDGLGVRAWTYGNGVRLRTERDPATGRITALRHQSPAGADLLHVGLRYDALGNVASETRQGRVATHLYDVHRRLVSTRAGNDAHHYAYDAGGSRPASATLQFDAAGRVVADAAYRYRWSADARLAAVLPRHGSGAEAATPIARYAYNAGGERVAVHDARGSTLFLHQGGRVAAELESDGSVRRHYLYLDGVPVATIDRVPTGERHPDGRVRTRTQVHYLHVDHLRAPLLATDRHARPVWRASHGPFGEPADAPGAIHGAAAFPSARRIAYRQPLVFAGHYRDDTTGLHYNLQRYYDPRAGRYLSPDPLGPAATLDAYGYAEANPRSAIDPQGMILFAFDGTGNAPDARTNIWWLVEQYRDNDSGVIGASRPFYEAGPGSAWWAAGDGALAYTLSAAVSRQLGRLDDYLLASAARARALTSAASAPLRPVIDVIGFSRGAAAARSFTNQVAARMRDGHYLRLLQGRCVDVQLRFMGLFDTVLSIAAGSFDLRIPPAVAHAAHAVAVNEHRALFPLESIEPDFAAIGAAPGRIELGFIGSHSDVGGGYACVNGCAGGDLSDVALNWMSQQARRAGVALSPLAPAQRTVTQPLLHSEIHGWPYAAWGADQDRAVRYPGAANAPAPPPAQRVAPIAGLDTAASADFITPAPDPARALAGTVDLSAYRTWLAANYGLVLAP